MILYLLRHGETDLNKQRRIQGRSDIPINEKGRRLAEATAQGLKDVAFDLAFTSPLIRAKETAQLVLAGRDIPVYEEPRIQEIGFGEYEGLCCSEENYNIPDKDFLKFFTDPAHYQVPPKGESFWQVMERTGAFLSELVSNREYEDKTILISTHGCALKALLANVNHTPIDKFWGEGVHKNCAVTILKAENEKLSVLEEGKVFY